MLKTNRAHGNWMLIGRGIGLSYIGVGPFLSVILKNDLQPFCQLKFQSAALSERVEN
jgi:hypothetical protein